ncbi:MAG: hypothetical protein K9L17_07030 [Clostridiales bacterium]|nr:hypothetical protein [Clostridiales bacterium]MCF8022425.1 hypothetical protein [Clostridiales bacterium]
MFKILKYVFLIVFVIIFLILATSLIANYWFNQKVKKEVKVFFNDVEDKKEIIQKADLEALPSCVKKWLKYSGLVGKEKIRTVRLKQKASMRLKKGLRWMPTVAEQYFTADQPGFIWKAKIKAAPLFHIMGRDKYYEGKGNMLIKILSLVTVANSKGKEIDQGTMLRYLAETVWFPSAALSSYITWEEIDAKSARATMSYGGITASGIFTFNKKGEVINFTAERYGEFNGQFKKRTWLVCVNDYKEFNGIKVPAKAEVTWRLDTGDFNWYKLKVTDIDHNKPVIY